MPHPNRKHAIDFSETQNNPLSRRNWIHNATAGVSSLALATMLDDRSMAVSPHDEVSIPIDPIQPLKPRPTHFQAKVDRMIFLFQYGSPSQVDTFDYKPELQKREGHLLPDSYYANPKLKHTLSYGKELMASPFAWRQHGQNGLWVSELFPHVANHADDLCVVRSMFSDSNNHAPASLNMNTGVLIEGKPSLGAWLTYGLGSVNQNLPGYVVLYNIGPYGGPANFANGFLQPAFSGIHFRDQGPPVLDLVPPSIFDVTQRQTIDLVQRLNRMHQASRPGYPELDGRIAAYELAYRMQAEAMSMGDLGSETKETIDMYGIHDKETADYGRMCLLSRRLIESGVRVVQLYNGVASPKDGWDAHTKLEENHRYNAKRTDKPIAALLKDLKQRGLLENTLVVWCGEFGRTPMWDSGSGRLRSDAGRNHNPLGFSIWMAGGGIRGGRTIGATDEFGLFAQESPYSVRDLHATILHCFGLDANQLYFTNSGRQERLIGVADSANVIEGLFG